MTTEGFRSCTNASKRNQQSTSALEDTELLHQVVDFKRKFYPRAWARYDLAYPGKIQLMPANHIRLALLNDYGKMKEMIYGVYPAWNEILDGLHHLEIAINGNHT